MIPQHSHPRLQQWLQSNYPRPQLDPEWLRDCSEWLYSDRRLSPDSNFQTFIGQFECQLLSSDLRDSMLHGTGLPIHIARPTTNTILTGPPILVEIASITEIAHSAFSLEQVRVAREERERLGDLVEDDDDAEGDIDVDEGPPPKFPRGMLKFELTDGATSLPAVEYRHLPEVTLGVTPLGFKMQLNNVKIRNGIAWLEPETAIMKKYSTKDREIRQKFDFARGLRRRMGLPLEPISQPTENSTAMTRSPLQDIVAPSTSEPSHNDDNILENRRRRIPTTTPTQNNAQIRPTRVGRQAIASGSAAINASPYFSFSASQSGMEMTRTEDSTIARSSVIDMTQDDLDEQFFTAQTPISGRGQEGSTTRRHTKLADARGKGSTIEIHDDEDDFDEKFVVDDAFLESLNRVELEAMQGVGTSKEPTPTLPSRMTGPGPSYNISAYKPTTQNIIEIMDDEDCEDKENMPVATRHVRRRTNLGIQEAGLASMSGDVIDLSD